eukprot:IDg23619t1
MRNGAITIGADRTNAVVRDLRRAQAAERRHVEKQRFKNAQTHRRASLAGLSVQDYKRKMRSIQLRHSERKKSSVKSAQLHRPHLPPAIYLSKSIPPSANITLMLTPSHEVSKKSPHVATKTQYKIVLLRRMTGIDGRRYRTTVETAEAGHAPFGFTGAAGVPITLLDWASLENGKWVTDAILAAHANLINAAAPLAYFVDPQFYTHLVRAGNKGVRKWGRRSRFEMSKYSRVFVPLHRSRNYCTLAIIDIAAQSLTHYDLYGDLEANDEEV